MFLDPGIGTGEKGFCELNKVKMMVKSARKVAETTMMEFMFMFQDKISGGKNGSGEVKVSFVSVFYLKHVSTIVFHARGSTYKNSTRGWFG